MTPTAAVETKWLDLFPELAGTRRFTVGEYHRLIDAGMLGPSDHVELLDGYIVYKPDYVTLPVGGPFPEWRLLRRWSVPEYRKMFDLGVISREEKLELLDGYLVLKMGQNPPHRNAMTRLVYCLPPRLPAGWVYMVNSTVETEVFEPEPDGLIVRGEVRDYEDRNPVPADFGIVIEVSDSSLFMDRTGKGRTFAREGIPVYWIVNVVDKQIEVYSDPDAGADPPAYRTRTDYKPGDAVPIALDGAVAGTVPARELLP